MAMTKNIMSQYTQAMTRIHLKILARVFKVLVSPTTTDFAFLSDGFLFNFRELFRNFINQTQDAIIKNHTVNTSRVVAIKFVSVLKLLPGMLFIISIDGNVKINDTTMIMLIYITLVAIFLFFPSWLYITLLYYMGYEDFKEF